MPVSGREIDSLAAACYTTSQGNQVSVPRHCPPNPFRQGLSLGLFWPIRGHTPCGMRAYVAKWMGGLWEPTLRLDGYGFPFQALSGLAF